MKNEVLKHYFPEESKTVEHVEPSSIENKPLLSQEYNNEFRHVNKSPQKIKKLLETESNPEEIKALKLALDY